METTFNCSTCNYKENLRYNYPCRSCVYNEFAPDATLHCWEPRKDTIKMKDFTQNVLDDHGVPVAMKTFYRLELKNTPKENGRRMLANPEVLLKKIKAATENDNYMWKDWNC